MSSELYLSAHQTRSRPPTAYEDRLADALERAFGAGAVGLDDLSARLNAGGPKRSDGSAWTAENLQREFARLAGD
jgi:hypothetical protein